MLANFFIRALKSVFSPMIGFLDFVEATGLEALLTRLDSLTGLRLMDSANVL